MRNKELLHLSYEIKGDGNQTIVFLHGFMESNLMWEPLHLEQLKSKIVLVELPGHGHSSLMDDVPSIENMAYAVKKTLDVLKVRNYHVVGHSLGGYVALSLKEIDKQCQKVVLLNSNFWQDSDEKKKDRIRVAAIALESKNLLIQTAIPALFYRHSSNDQFVTDTINGATKMLGESLAYASLAMRDRKDQSILLFKYPSDFLIIHGNHDPLVSVSLLDEKTENCSVQKIILKDSGHMAHYEQPIATRNAIRNFLLEN